jgi:arabinan endo-1,5-alpha-L-arabinosidase
MSEEKPMKLFFQMTLVLLIFVTAAFTNLQQAAEPTVAPEPGTFVNPVLDQDFPDPDILRVGDTFYAYATNIAGVHIQAAKSTDLVNWEVLPDVLPVLPDWAQDGLWNWAPEVTTSADGQTYLMYYTTRFRIENGGTQCIGVATSDMPEGPFQPAGDEPLICQPDRGGSIDPSTFVDDDDTHYILWKNDGNSLGGITWLWLQEISDDGLTLVGEPMELIKADQGWEGVLVEAPTLWKYDGKYYLFYSANLYDSPRYAIGYAVADDISGPYVKPDEQPLLASIIRPGGLIGPGGQDIVLDDNGASWLFYHVWAPGGYRNMNLIPLLWQDGVPVVEPPTREAQPAPVINE